MRTLRFWLRQIGVDLSTCTLLYRARIDTAPIILIDHGKISETEKRIKLLDFKFDRRSKDFPDVIIFDHLRIYFIDEYDGASWFTWIYKDHASYMQDKERIFHPAAEEWDEDEPYEEYEEMELDQEDSDLAAKVEHQHSILQDILYRLERIEEWRIKGQALPLFPPLKEQP